MFSVPSLVLSAWVGNELVGLSRSLTDYAYCCYLSDLAVDKKYQGAGIGKELVRRTQAIIGDQVSLILLSAPDAMQHIKVEAFDTQQQVLLLRFINPGDSTLPKDFILSVRNDAGVLTIGGKSISGRFSWGMMVGSAPLSAAATMRARGFRPWVLPAASEPTSTAAAPSTMPEELPAWWTWLISSSSG